MRASRRGAGRSRGTLARGLVCFTTSLLTKLLLQHLEVAFGLGILIVGRVVLVDTREMLWLGERALLTGHQAILWSSHHTVMIYISTTL